MRRELTLGVVIVGLLVAPTAGAEEPALWETKRFTLACRSLRSAEAFALLDATGASKPLLNPKSDPSKTDCRHVRKGERVAILGRASNDLVRVRVGRDADLLMLSSDLIPGGTGKK